MSTFEQEWQNWPLSAKKRLADLLDQEVNERRSQLIHGFPQRPELFFNDYIDWRDESPAPYQIEIARSLFQNHRVVVRGPRGLGKTTDASVIIHLFIIWCENDGVDWKIVTTAGSWSQLKNYLWPEIHKWSRRIKWEKLGLSKYTADELLTTEIKMEHGAAFSMASKNPDLSEGMHSSRQLILFDECKAIEGVAWDSMEGALTSGDNYWLGTGTPGKKLGRFYEIHARKPGYEDWTAIHITLKEVLAAGRVDPSWVEQRARQWGKGSALYKQYCLGEFSSGEDAGLIPLEWAENSIELWHEREKHWKVFPQERPKLTCISLDVGETRDKTILAPRYGNHIGQLKRIVIEDVNLATMDVVKQTEEWLLKRGHAPGGNVYIVVDALGVGAGVAHRLREKGWKVMSFKAGCASDATDSTGELQFADLRTEYMWKLMEAMDPAGNNPISIPPDDELLQEVIVGKWDERGRGKIKFQSKDQIKPILGRSTDRLDAVYMSQMGKPRALPSWGKVAVG